MTDAQAREHYDCPLCAPGMTHAAAGRRIGCPACAGVGSVTLCLLVRRYIEALEELNKANLRESPIKAEAWFWTVRRLLVGLRKIVEVER